MIIYALPIWTVDIIGSILMIVFSFLCLNLVFALKRRDHNNVVWTYMLMFCLGLTAFAVSRSAGHILKQILLLSDHKAIWASIRPFSGAINSFMFVFVGSVTLFFERVWNLYQEISRGKQSLQSAHKELLFLNQNLEDLITQRTKALKLSEQKYRRIFEVSRDMILVTKIDGRIVDLNPVGYQMLGYKEKDASPEGKNFKEFFLKEADWHYLIDDLREKNFILNKEIDLKRRDGSIVLSLISVSLDRGSPEFEETIHFLVKDIEQRRLMEKRMSQTEKLASIGQLSAGIAHEINNPLGIILGYTQLLMRNEADNPELHADLKTVEKHVRNCKSIVEDLLNFARSSSPEKEKIDINQTADDVLNFMQHHSDLGDIEIRKDYDKKIPPMLLDEKKIKQVFINLLMNSIYAVGKKGTIRLTTEYKPVTGEAAIRVKDTGHIEKKNLSRIFDPFFTTRPTGEGTGLGLSVSYGIIKNHGGDIFVNSSPEFGTEFTVVLPIASENEKVRG